jgi:hypothetical protein
MNYGDFTILAPGEKPFVCETCGANFFIRGNLNKHIKVRNQRCSRLERFWSRDNNCYSKKLAMLFVNAYNTGVVTRDRWLKSSSNAEQRFATAVYIHNSTYTRSTA